MKSAGESFSITIRRWVFLSIGLAAGAASLGARVEAAQPAAVVPVHIKGKLIQKLILQERGGTLHDFNQPGPVIQLPPGAYRAETVQLKGGYQSRPGRNAEVWHDIVPGESSELQVGAPLRPGVSVTSSGGSLHMQYCLRDSGGTSYSDARVAGPPRFTVYEGDREIGSGSFRYG